MNTIDLHVHSNISDGSLTPSQVTELAYRSGLSAFALTDHDCTDGCHEAQSHAGFLRDSGKVTDFEVINGVEISAGYNNRDIHILGLYIDPDNKELNEALALTRERRFKRNQEMIKRFNDDGIDISYEELTFGNPNTIITRGHFSRLLIKKGYASDRNDSFARYLNPDSPYYVEREYINMKQTITLIHNAGGLSFLAHPLLYNFDETHVEKMIKEFKEAGGTGVEAIYSSNTEEDEKYVSSLAVKYNMLISGGTDFHGACKPDLKIGTGRGNMSIPYEILETIKNRQKLILME
ncbi:MAG: PHP domain-containing protein [Lachnospiraceae bacterium]